MPFNNLILAECGRAESDCDAAGAGVSAVAAPVQARDQRRRIADAHRQRRRVVAQSQRDDPGGGAGRPQGRLHRVRRQHSFHCQR